MLGGWQAALLLATCFECDDTLRLPPFVRNRRLERNCGSCHAKVAFKASRLQLEEHSAPRREGVKEQKEEDPMERDLAAFRQRVTQRPITEGQPLPDLGKCKHFKKSRRWLRFSCCGKAFPCPICHEASGCPAAVFGIMAHRMICGQCSREQDFSNALCAFCGFNMVKSSSATHGWHGGEGTRDRSVLSKKDKKKYSGVNKTVAAKKVAQPKGAPRAKKKKAP